MRSEKRLINAFGKNEAGLADVPQKISGVKIARLFHGEVMGCSRCFPHGFETRNSTISKHQRSWKEYRKSRWKGSPRIK